MGLAEHPLQKVPMAGAQSVLDNLLSSGSNPGINWTVRMPPAAPKMWQEVAFSSLLYFIKRRKGVKQKPRSWCVKHS